MHADSRPDPALVDAVAQRVLELLERRALAPASGELLTFADVAARYRVRPSWVYAHQRELGVVRLGDGPRARLRFDAQVVAASVDRHAGRARTRSEDHRLRRRRRRRLPSRTPPPLT
jgi:hypothetical protein